MQFPADKLAAAVGLGGRDRKTGSAAKRARVNITRAIRVMFTAALARIRAHSPALAGHLDDHPHRHVLLLRALSARPDHLAH